MTMTSKGLVIRCENVPVEFFSNRTKAKQYFWRFGRISQLVFKRKSRTCLVTYCNEEAVTKALDSGGDYNGHKFTVAREDRYSHTATWQPSAEVQSEVNAMSSNSFALAFPQRPSNKRKKSSTVDCDQEPVTRKRTLLPNESAVNLEETNLLRIVNEPACTIDEKFRVLDARDKLIRIRMRRSGIEMTRQGPTIGTCADMCPEKERLLRTLQRQMASYELDANTRQVQPQCVIKQYSRSSADQETPLPHELRPVHVLQMTMTYLTHNIMNMCDLDDVNLGEWYHFLWDRTRGIRKDITQQALCSAGAVALVEQCARFHIYCAARLIAEDPAIFDQKINTENLTKCLQTLKYMYNDLWQQNGTVCPNEAEFRAYIILLNLNDGNFMWELQQLREPVQQSAHVKFALSIYAALDTNNYVRFFKLVATTTLLNACTLMRYFVQVRSRAIAVMIKCFCVPRVTTHAFMSVDEFTGTLHFENTAAALDFAEYFGLYSNEMGTRVMFDRSTYQVPECQYHVQRAIRLVESKRAGRSLESVVTNLPCIYDGKVPTAMPLHIPHDSFDQLGRLQFDEAIDVAEDNDNSRNSSCSSQGEESVCSESNNSADIDIAVETSRQPEMEETNTEAKWNLLFRKNDASTVPCVDSSIFGGTLEQNEQIFGGKMTVPSEESDSSNDECYKDFISAPLMICENQQQLIQDDAEPQIETKEKKNVEQFVPFVADDSGSLPPSSHYEHVENEKQVISPMEYDDEKHAAEQQMAEEKEAKQQTEETVQDLIDSGGQQSLVVKDSCQLYAETTNALMEDSLIIASDIPHAAQHDVFADSQSNTKGLFNAFRKWQVKTCRRRTNRTFMLDLQLPKFQTAKECAQQLELSTVVRQQYSLHDQYRYRSGHAYNLQVVADESSNFKGRIRQFLPKCFKTLSQRLLTELKKIPREIYFKCDILLDSNVNNRTRRNLDDYIEWPDSTNKLESSLIHQYKMKSQCLVCCIEKTTNESINLSNTNGLVVFVGGDFYRDTWPCLQQFNRQAGQYIQLPVVVMLLEEHGTGTVSLSLKDCIDRDLRTLKYVSNYRIFNAVDGGGVSHETVSESLTFIAETCDLRDPPLEMNTLKVFLIESFVTCVFQNVALFSCRNRDYWQYLQSANNVVHLYNTALKQLTAVLLDAEIGEWRQFPCKEFVSVPSEFNGYPADYKHFPLFIRDRQYSNVIATWLTNLRLPRFYQSINFSIDMMAICDEALHDYCAQLFVSKALAEKCYQRIIQRVMSEQCHFLSIGKCESNLFWLDAVHLLLVEKLNEINESMSEYEEYAVAVYNREKFNAYLDMQWLYEQIPISTISLHNATNDTCIVEQEESEENALELHLDVDKVAENLGKPRSKSVPSNSILKQLKVCHKISADLECSFGITKRMLSISKEFLANATLQK